MPNYNGVWSLSTHYQNRTGWPLAPLPAGTGLFIGGSDQTAIDYVNIATTGNASDFGDLSFSTEAGAGCSSATRAFYFAGQKNNSYTTDIAFVTYVIGSVTTDFGDQTHENSYAAYPAGLSNSTRGVVAGGSGSASPYYLNTIQYITMASAGNSTDFGDLTVARSRLAAFASTTRGVFAPGRGASGDVNTLDYITISSTGNATDFGDDTATRQAVTAAASSTRGVIAGGNVSGTASNVISYVTTASTGNATDFGDLSVARDFFSGCSSSIRAVFAGGTTADPSYTALNTMDYITIGTTGNALDFGDLTSARKGLTAGSNAHGGLA